MPGIGTIQLLYPRSQAEGDDIVQHHKYQYIRWNEAQHPAQPMSAIPNASHILRDARSLNSDFEKISRPINQAA
jgi:hypothetical protein